MTFTLMLTLKAISYMILTLIMLTFKQKNMQINVIFSGQPIFQSKSTLSLYRYYTPWTVANVNIYIKPKHVQL